MRYVIVLCASLLLSACVSGDPSLSLGCRHHLWQLASSADTYDHGIIIERCPP